VERTRTGGKRQRADRRPELRPDQILDAAQRLLIAGSADFTMDALAESADLAKGTLYHYYRTKVEVMEALRRRYLTRSVEAGLAKATDAPSILQRLDGFIRSLLDEAVTNGTLVWALFHDTGTSGNRTLEIVSDALQELIRRGVETGELSINNVEAVARFYSYGFFGRIEAALHSSDIDVAELAAELTDMLRRLTTAS
jgi:AcrR family transcriptional regulator